LAVVGGTLRSTTACKSPTSTPSSKVVEQLSTLTSPPSLSQNRALSQPMKPDHLARQHHSASMQAERILPVTSCLTSKEVTPLMLKLRRKNSTHPLVIVLCRSGNDTLGMVGLRLSTTAWVRDSWFARAVAMQSLPIVPLPRKARKIGLRIKIH